MVKPISDQCMASTWTHVLPYSSEHFTMKRCFLWPSNMIDTPREKAKCEGQY